MWIDGLADGSLDAYLGSVATETLADDVQRGPAPDGVPTATVRLEAGEARIALRRAGDA